MVASLHDVLRDGWQAGAPTTCFDDDDRYDYYLCCRDVKRDGYPLLAGWCFGDEWVYEECCSWGFGPSIRGLPYKCQLEADGVAEFFFGFDQPLEIQCSDPAQGADRGEAQDIWFTGYLIARFLLAPSKLFTVPGWGDAQHMWRGRLADLIEKPSWNILDVGCGVGVTSVALARAGHTVTGVDIDQYALRVAQANARRNKVRMHLQVWDVFESPDVALVARGPFDVIMSEVVGFVTSVQQARGNLTVSNLTDVALSFLHNTLPLRGRVFVMGAYYSAGHGKDHGKLDIASVAVMRALRRLGQRPDMMVPCSGTAGPLCPRTPTVSPRDWHFQSSLGPRTAHALILW